MSKGQQIEPKLRKALEGFRHARKQHAQGALGICETVLIGRHYGHGFPQRLPGKPHPNDYSVMAARSYHFEEIVRGSYDECKDYVEAQLIKAAIDALQS